MVSKKEAIEKIVDKVEWEGSWEALADYGDIAEMKEFPSLQQSWESFCYALHNLRSTFGALEEEYYDD